MLADINAPYVCSPFGLSLSFGQKVEAGILDRLIVRFEQLDVFRDGYLDIGVDVPSAHDVEQMTVQIRGTAVSIEECWEARRVKNKAAEAERLAATAATGGDAGRAGGDLDPREARLSVDTEAEDLSPPKGRPKSRAASRPKARPLGSSMDNGSLRVRGQGGSLASEDELRAGGGGRTSSRKKERGSMQSAMEVEAV